MPRPYEVRKFVAFVDMLGYQSLVLNGATSPEQKFNSLYSIYENLTIAAQTCVSDLSPVLPSPVRWVHFSDAFFFSSDSATALVTTVAQFFCNVFSLHGRSGIEGGEWLPFLRGGVAYDWVFEGFDQSNLQPGQTHSETRLAPRWQRRIWSARRLESRGCVWPYQVMLRQFSPPNSTPFLPTIPFRFGHHGYSRFS